MNKSEQNRSSSVQAGGELEGKKPIVDQARDALTNVAGQAREQVTHRIDVRKDRAVETISDVAGALRETGEKLDGVGPLGDVAGRAAEGIERLAHFFEGKQVNDIVRDVERFARREPALFLGAAFAAGLIGGRFLKSSARRNEGAGFGAGRGLRDEGWEMATYGGDGYLASEDLEDYELRRYGAAGVGSSRNGSFRDTLPMEPRSTQGASTFGNASSSERSYASSSRVESEGPAIKPTPIVSAAAANETKATQSENTTAPMPATQGSAGASASTSSSSSNVPSAPSAPGNGHTGRV